MYAATVVKKLATRKARAARRAGVLLASGMLTPRQQRRVSRRSRMPISHIKD